MATQIQLQQALQALYHGDPAVKDQANKWLEQFQQSTEAWQVTNDVLHDAGAGMEAHYFCAQTLRTKVRRRRVGSGLPACLCLSDSANSACHNPDARLQ
jgi:transportin-3